MDGISVLIRRDTHKKMISLSFFQEECHMQAREESPHQPRNLPAP